MACQTVEPKAGCASLWPPRWNLLQQVFEIREYHLIKDPENSEKRTFSNWLEYMAPFVEDEWDLAELLPEIVAFAGGSRYTVIICKKP